MELLWIVLAPFLLAPLAPFVARALPRAAGWLLALLPVALFLLLSRHLLLVSGGTPLTEATPWVAELGIHLAFHLDGFSLLFALLITGIGALVAVYSGGYLAGERDLGRFYGFLFAFMGSMLGIVLADDLILLFVFWELTSLTSFFLIGYHHEDPVSRRNALQALLVTAAGGLAMLAGLLLLSGVTGTMRISEILHMGDTVRAHPFYLSILLLILAGALTKSAQFPFHFWLPNAMAAPTPVSAYLHSATMVKAGVYLLARLHPTIGGTPAWLYILVILGAITMLLGAYLAFRHRDLKLILAYTTVSALGTLVLLIGIGTQLAVTAFVVYLLAHALYKGAFFLIAGAVDHATGTRDIERLGALARKMPLVTTAAVLAGLSLAGLPPFLSFIAKEGLIEAALESPILVLALIAVIASGIFFVAIAIKLVYRPFFGPPKDTPEHAHEAPPSLWLGPAVLTLTGLLFGLVPMLGPEELLAQAGTAIHGSSLELHLELWHGFTLPLAISVGVVILGALLYAFRDEAARLGVPFDRAARWGPEATYHRAVAGLLHVATWQTRTIQTTHIRHYFTMIFLTATLAITLTFLIHHGIPQLPSFTHVPVHEAIVTLMVLGGAIFTAVARSRLTAVIALGLVGYGIALLFILFGAPDLALTQFLFETLIVLLFTFVLVRMPAFTHRSSHGTRVRDAGLGALVGLLMAVLILIVTATSFHPPISEYFADNSYLLAHGRNVVNVILVDFRGLDTLGEIVVIAVAAVGAFALLSMRQRRAKSAADQPEVRK